MKKVIDRAQNEIAITERNLKQMEERWNLLDPSDKSYYKQKMTENK